MKTQNSSSLFKKSLKIFPGGVNSPVRAFKSVGGEPRFIQKAKGALLQDADGNFYIDYVGSWGPLVMGHAHPQVIKAIKKAAELGTSYGAPCEQESILGKLIQKYYPGCEKLRLVSSGTEAVMGAIRLARAFTGRDKIIKFEGCYHGHSDSLLVKAGSGALTFGVPTSKGVPSAFAELTLTATYNNLEEVQKLFKANPKQIACVIIEPVVGNSGCILPEDGFLEALQTLTQKEGSLLIFDEVMTGFRVALGGAQSLYKIKPDLTTLGKVIGGGLPVGAFGGRAEIMDLLAPLGPVYQAGTLSGNPLAMAAGIETLKLITQKANFSKMQKNTKILAQGIKKIAQKLGIALQVPYIGGMMGIFFSDKPVRNLQEAQKSDIEKFNRFFKLMLETGIYLPPSAYEAWFVSAIHNEKEISKTLQAVEKSLKGLLS